MKQIVIHSKIQSTVLTFILLLFIWLPSKAQEQVLAYKVIQGGDEIGWLKLNRNTTGNSTVITSTSEVKKRFVFLFTLSERQEALFQNGLLIRSYFYRKQNSTVKANKQASYTGTFYEVKKDGYIEKVMITAATENLQSIYFHEPDKVTQVYSDNFQCMADIKHTGNKQYMIKIPGGSTNYYTYENGVCTKVKIEHALFTVELLLVKQS